jgi:hypothetical protein
VTTTIKLRSPKELGPALRKLGRRMDAGMVVALRKTARFGATQAVRVSATSTPRPRATGTYERSFVVTQLRDGAVLSNSAAHAIFVELGRRPGRMPPVAKIVAWMIAKRIASRGGSRAELERAALRIARKIGKRGTKGRHVMQRLLPIIRKRLRVEIEAEMARVFATASR